MELGGSSDISGWCCGQREGPPASKWEVQDSFKPVRSLFSQCTKGYSCVYAMGTDLHDYSSFKFVHMPGSEHHSDLQS